MNKETMQNLIVNGRLQPLQVGILIMYDNHQQKLNYLHEPA